MASILPRIAAGETAALQDCVDRYGGLVWAIARRLLGDTAEAEEAVGDAFRQIWRDADQFDPKLAPERVHVAMLARRSAVRRLRERGRSGADALPEAHRRPPDRGPAPRELGEEERRAARALRALPEARRHVLGLAVHRGLDHRQIAEITGIPPGSVKDHVTRGLAAVREALLSPDAAGD